MQNYKTEKYLFSGGCWKWGKIKSLESYSVWGEKEQPRIQPSRQTRRRDKSESGAKANWSSTCAGRTKRHLFFIYWVLFSGSCVKLKIQSIVIAQNLFFILSMPVYKKRIISYFSNPEKGKKKQNKDKTPYVLLKLKYIYTWQVSDLKDDHLEVYEDITVPNVIYLTCVLVTPDNILRIRSILDI